MHNMIAIDGGGTKTEFLLFNSKGDIAEKFKLSATNPAVVGLEKACETLALGIERCMQKNNSIKYVFAGLAGAYHDEIIKFLKNKFEGIEFCIENDAINLLSSGGADIGVICGTGSIVVAREDEKSYRIGGWGNRFGDMGSAFNIAREAIRCALDMEDKTGEETVIRKLLCEELEISEEQKIFSYLDEISEKGVSYIASLSKVVFKAYSLKDKVAEKIVDNEMREIIKKVNKISELYNCGNHVVAGGGVFEHNKEILLPIIKRYALKHLEFIFPELPPIYGACIECCKLAGVEITEKFYDNFKSQYKTGE